MRPLGSCGSGVRRVEWWGDAKDQQIACYLDHLAIYRARRVHSVTSRPPDDRYEAFAELPIIDGGPFRDAHRRQDCAFCKLGTLKSSGYLRKEGGGKLVRRRPLMIFSRASIHFLAMLPVSMCWVVKILQRWANPPVLMNWIFHSSSSTKSFLG